MPPKIAGAKDKAKLPTTFTNSTVPILEKPDKLMQVIAEASAKDEISRAMLKFA
jgi:hypothetical protein